MTDPRHDPALAEMQQAAQTRLTDILTDAQTAVREAQRLIASIPAPYRQNGMRAATDGITERLDRADELFVAAFKSIHQTYGATPGAGALSIAEPGAGIVSIGSGVGVPLAVSDMEARAS